MNPSGRGVLATPTSPAPRHVAIIMDGNGRWAKSRRLPRLKGHEEGSHAVEHTIRAAAEMGVQVLTLYAFSVENWTRPKLEIRGLMLLLIRSLRNYTKKLGKEGIRLTAIGRLSDLPAPVRKELERAIAATASNTRMTVVLALSYGGRVEITEACRKIAALAVEKQISPADIDEALISNHLYTRGIPDPDLLIRTSGEMRVSNFLLWQMSYTEMFITPVLWPDFRAEHLLEAVTEFNRRQRRFGGV
jgi:undecaprenyl diphosphate synthase